MTKKKSHHQFYLPWYAGDEHVDNWFSYIHRNLHHIEGEDIPFTASSWHYGQEDAGIHDEVLDALYKSDEVDASNISVLVINGNVQLTGCVKSMEEKIVAGEIVMKLPDVWSVSNVLVIRAENAGYRL